MKRFIGVVVVAALVGISAGTALAAGQAHMNVGCGLGTLLWEGRADNKILSQTLQGTTNGTGSQTIAITIGTSQCSKPSQWASDERIHEFVLANMDNLAKDVAVGGGETLDAFSELISLPAAERPAAYARLQSNFSTIFPSEHVVLAQVVDSLATVIAN